MARGKGLGKGYGKGGAKFVRKLSQNAKDDISFNDISRLFNKAGALRLSSLVPDHIRAILKDILVQLMKNTTIVTEYGNHKTVSQNHVRLGIKYTDGLKLTTISVKSISGYKGSKIGTKKSSSDEASTSTKKIRFKPKTTTIRRIRKLQKTGMFLIRMAPFQRLVREVGDQYMSDLRFSTDALKLIQASVEEFLTELANDSNLAAIHAERQTVMPKDVRLSLVLKGLRDSRVIYQ